MANILSQSAWFLKYQPKEISEYVFCNEKHEEDVYTWVNNKHIPGNVLLYGNAGCGKTSLAELLVKKILNRPDVNLNIIIFKGVLLVLQHFLFFLLFL